MSWFFNGLLNWFDRFFFAAVYNFEAFWTHLQHQWMGWLNDFFLWENKVSTRLWGNLRQAGSMDIAWRPFYDFLWQDILGIARAFQITWRNIFDFLWASLIAIFPSVGNLWQSITAFISSEDAPAYVAIIVRLVFMLFLLRLVRPFVNWFFFRTASLQQRMLIRSAIHILIIGSFIVSLMSLLSPDVVNRIFQAAGVFTIALGFAAQTSVSNLISGLFLIIERAVELEDLIEIEGTLGFVTRIGPLSTSLRTFQNLLVRIPNETMVKTKIINYSRLPLRRIDVRVGVDYRESIPQVRELLFKVANDHPLVLEEPQPLFIFLGFGDSSLDLQLSVWSLSENYLNVLNDIHIKIKDIFDANDINIPFPHVTLYTGSETLPFPVDYTPVDMAHFEKSASQSATDSASKEVADDENSSEKAASEKKEENLEQLEDLQDDVHSESEQA